MPLIIGSFIRGLAYVLSTVGILDLWDKFSGKEAVSPGFKIPKLFYLIAAFTLAIILVRQIGKTFKINQLKN